MKVSNTEILILIGKLQTKPFDVVNGVENCDLIDLLQELLDRREAVENIEEILLGLNH